MALFYILDHTLEAPVLPLGLIAIVYSTFVMRRHQRSRFIGPPQSLQSNRSMRLGQAITGAVVLILCLCVIALAAQADAASAATLGPPIAIGAAYTSVLVGVFVMHFMAARSHLVPWREQWLGRRLAFTPAYLLLMALSSILTGLLTLMESALLDNVFLTALMLVRGQFRWGMFSQVLLSWMYVVLTSLVMLWCFFPTTDTWMRHAGWSPANLTVP